MPFQLDENDVAIFKSRLGDGRKSFRQISRETGITTPTVKARFERLVNVGFIKGVVPVFDFSKVEPGKRTSSKCKTPEKTQRKERRLIKILPITIS
jgi:DNA-binding Lrp family transcriptional regulator